MKYNQHNQSIINQYKEWQNCIRNNQIYIPIHKAINNEIILKSKELLNQYNEQQILQQQILQANQRNNITPLSFNFRNNNFDNIPFLYYSNNDLTNSIFSSLDLIYNIKNIEDPRIQFYIKTKAAVNIGSQAGMNDTIARYAKQITVQINPLYSNVVETKCFSNKLVILREDKPHNEWVQSNITYVCPQKLPT